MTDRYENSYVLPKAMLDDLISILQGDGFEVLGPKLDQEAIVYGPLRCADELPIGWTDVQSPGNYRLKKRQDKMYFGYAVGPHSWKKYLFPSSLLLWAAQKKDGTLTVQKAEHQVPRRAFLGIRSCELHAMAIQDRVFMDPERGFTDAHYSKARSQLFIIAVECEVPGETCFCTSMGTGPEIREERIPLPQVVTESDEKPVVFDLQLTELDDEFVVKPGSSVGKDMIDRLQLTEASHEQTTDAAGRVQEAARSMSKLVDVNNIQELLQSNQEHSRWDDVAERCLSCTNCTMVCPTCFCSSVEDVNDLTLENAQRIRRWDSCFNPDFAVVHGGDFRPSIRGRYRQWLTHKFASWFDQFDVSGCVGCGRCITWCPVGIDVTEEITAIRRPAAEK